jgi:predicted hotdog family 3-hydroxylacyl-ACP dehydratase
VETFPDVQSLIPHSGPSCLLDAVLRFGPEGALCRASIPMDHPYLAGSSVHPLLAIELFAQAAAVHRALSQAPDEPSVAGGQLVAADVEVKATRLDVASDLLVRVAPTAAFGQLTKFSGELYRQGQERILVAHGEVSVAVGAKP